MLFVVPEKIHEKFHYSSDGGYLDEPHTEEEQKICDEFIQMMKREREKEFNFEE